METAGNAADANEAANVQHIVRSGIEDVFGSVAKHSILLGNNAGHGKSILDKLVGNGSEFDEYGDNEGHWD